jgi:flavin-dependent dehydrogenase
LAHLKIDVCVLGGGPAGASTAIKLRALGHSVIVIEKSAYPRRHIGESLTGAVLPLLEVLGVRDEVESASFLRTHASIVRWGGAVHRRESSAQAGFQVDRARFDEILLRLAAKTGADIMTSCRLDMIMQTSGGWTVNVHSENGQIAGIDCKFLVDATGRSSISGGARERVGAGTLALYGYWRDTGIRGPETRVEAGRSEWFWGALLPDGLFNGTVFIDPQRYKSGILQSGSLESFYMELIGSSELLSGCLSGVLKSKVQVCDASCTYAKRPVQSNLIKTGEAAYTIDPLSSQGVQTAIGSGIHAAVVVHTMLERPGDSSLARRFYVDRLMHSVDLHADAAAKFYADMGAVSQDHFWKSRSQSHRLFIASDDLPLPAPPLFKGHVQRRSGVRIKETPIVTHEFVISRKGVVAPHIRLPIVFIDGMEAAQLLEMVDGQISCEDLLRRWTEILPLQKAIKFLAKALKLQILQRSPIENCSTDQEREHSIREG